MRRRYFITILGTAIAWPHAVRAQQAAMPVIGFLHSASPDGYAPMMAPFKEGLKDAGYVEGQNVRIEYRWADNQTDRLPSLAEDLVRRNVAVIFAPAGVGSVLAAKAATVTIPIVFVIGADPVKFGLVASLNRPGGNVTGVSFLLNALIAKRVELVRELKPTARLIGLLVNTQNPNAESDTKDAQGAARKLGQAIYVVNASSDRELETSFANLVQQRIDALLVASDPYLFSRRNRIVSLAVSNAIPAIFDRRQAVADGGLVSYGTSFAAANRDAGNYVGRILNGEKPADLPVLQPTKFELVINLKTAKALGITVPQVLLVAADEVIE
jgi:putative tryptophan/tyrosine transport system substrate-binding protein